MYELSQKAEGPRNPMHPSTILGLTRSAMIDPAKTKKQLMTAYIGKTYCAAEIGTP